MHENKSIPDEFVFTDLEGNEYDVRSPDFDLERLRQNGLMPEDYELCGTCNFDHEYDASMHYTKIVKIHQEDDKKHDD